MKEARERVTSVLGTIRQFLQDQKRRGRVLPRELILSLLVDCLREEQPLTNQEKERRRTLRAKGIKYPPMKNVVPAKVHYRCELIWNLIFEPGAGRAPDPDKTFMSRTEAAELAARWLLGLGVWIGNRDRQAERRLAEKRKSQGRLSALDRTLNKSQARHGESVARAAKTLLAAYRRWNPKQAPDKPAGVYFGFKIIDGKRSADFSTDPKVIAAHKW